MENKFRVRLCSDLDYEEMVADIAYQNHTIAMITQENGIDNMEIEILVPDNDVKFRKFSLDEFIEAIRLAKARLIEMKKLPD